MLDQAWEQMIQEHVFATQAEALGIQVGEKEVTDMFIGPFPDPVVVQQFTGGQKPFDKNEVLQVKERAKTDANLAARLDQLINYLAMNRLQSKFNTLAGSSFVSKVEAKRRYMDENNKFGVEFLGVNYSVIPDSTIQVSDAEMSQYFEKNREEYKAKTLTAEIKYVMFPKSPSPQDIANLEMDMQKIRADFMTSTDDSSYASSKSDMPSGGAFVSISSLDPALKARTDTMKKGSVSEVYREGNYYKVLKYSDYKKDTVPSVKFKHIFVAFKNDTAAALKTATDIKAEVKKDNFAAIAAQKSEDPASGRSGGSVGWLKVGQYGEEFEKAVQKAPKGTIIGPIKSTQGFHIVEVEDKDDRLIRVCTIAKEIFPSQATLKETERKAMEFASKVAAAPDFEKEAQKQNLNPMSSGELSPTSNALAGLKSGKELIRWALMGNIKEISGVRSTDEAFVVAAIVKKSEEGYKTLDQVKDQVKVKVMNEKKSVIIMEKLKGLKGNSLEDLKTAYGNGAFVGRADNINITNANISGIGIEPVMVGKICKLKENQQLSPLAGQNGVYIIRVTQVSKKDNVDDKTLMEYLKNLEMTRRQQANGALYPALKEYVNPKDYRYKFQF